MAQPPGGRSGRSGRASRIVLPLLIGQVAGILWADRGGAVASWVAWIAAVGTLGVAVARVRGAIDASWVGRALLVGLAGLSFLVGHQALERTLAGARADAERAALLDPMQPRLVDARVLARRATRFGEAVELVDVRSRAGEERVPERLVLRFASGAGRAERLLWPGARVRVGIHVSPLRSPRNPGSPDADHALARRGFSARARLVKPDWVVLRIESEGGPAALGGRLARLRREIAERVRRRLDATAPRDAPAAGAALVRALALGDRSALAEPTRDAFRRLGLAHLISVSGLHVGFVALPAAWAVVRLRTLSRPRWLPVRGFALPLGAACAVAGCYAWLTGAGVPALRASLVFLLVGIGRAAGIRIQPVPALASAALVLLLADPALLFDLGARFSFVACAALIAGGVWSGKAEPARSGPASSKCAGARGLFSAGLRRVGAWGLDPMRASLAISIGLLPLVELAGLPRALPSPFVNALAIPWTGLVVLPAALAASMLAFALPAAFPAALAEPVFTLLMLPAAGLERSALALFAQGPTLGLGGEGVGRLPWGIALPAAAFALWRLRAGGWLAGLGAWVALASLGLAPVREAGFLDPQPGVVFLDVGQADAAVVRAGAETWLVDSGGGPDDGSGGAALIRALGALGVDRIDVLVITHGDLDHRGGAIRVLSAVKVGTLWLPAAAVEDPALIALERVARARGVRVRRVGAGDRGGGVDSLRADVLWPPKPARTRGSSDGLASAGPGTGVAAGDLRSMPGSPRGRPSRNDASIVLRLELAGRRFLFAADIGAEVERRLVGSGTSLRADVLKVGHHGSRTSSETGFLAAISPEIAIVSAPCIAARGLPSAAAFDRLRGAGAAIGWTGRDGAIAVQVVSAGRALPKDSGEQDAVPLRMRYWGDERRCVPDRVREAPGREAR